MLTRRESKDTSKFLDSIKIAKHRQQLESKMDELCRNPLPNDVGQLNGDGAAYVSCDNQRVTDPLGNPLSPPWKPYKPVVRGPQ